ncbi:MAG TPA: hypothetical protein VK678_03850, partial [Bradyrhizobium sp.]|nr:hypothetical protein [Bradyrhizobium sp.]
VISKHCRQRLGRMARRGRESASGTPRHCERSEAIHSFLLWQDGLLRFARNDGLSSAQDGLSQRVARMRGGDEVVCGFFVIASAAKQSILPLRGKMDCFASLAMTVYFGFFEN